MSRGWVAPVAQWHGSALVRDTCLDCYAQSGTWPETARLLYPTGMPRSQVEQGQEMRAKYLREHP